jgi:hypothetical protein
MSAIEGGADTLRGKFPCSPASLHGRLQPALIGSKLQGKRTPISRVDIHAEHHNLRSAASNVHLLAKLSAHATGRLLERRRDIDIERLLAEELNGPSFIV